MLLALFLSCQSAPPARALAPGPKVEAVLVADKASLSPGGTFTLAARLSLPEGWHVYWLNPGETGLATSAELTAPPGFVAEGPMWPGPERFVSPGDITSYGWAGEAWALWTVSAPAQPEPATFLARADWLACKDVCVKGEAELSLTLPYGADAPGEDLREPLSRLPRAASAWPGATLSWSSDQKTATIALPGATDAQLFPGAALELAMAGVEVQRAGRGRALVLTLRTPQTTLPFGVVRVATPSGPAVYLDLSTFNPEPP